MATKVYESKVITFLDGAERTITPLKIIYLRPFMEIFEKIRTDDTLDKDQVMDLLLECTAISMKQYYPEIATKQHVENNLDIASMYDILEVAAGISMKSKDEEEQPKSKKPTSEKDSSSWDSLDLAELESEVFLLGIWKDYYELESSLSLPELTAILNAQREKEYENKKFAAGLKGIDLDEASGRRSDDPWQAMKDRVFGGGASSNGPKDITEFTGKTAVDAGFGIGMGISYTNLQAPQQ
jgi:hypothetical protein